MSATTTSRPLALTTSAVVVALLPLITVVLVVFLATGLAIPALPLHVHQGLGLGTFVVGLVIGSQFAASLISRIWSGHYGDRHGAKRALSPAYWRPPSRVCSIFCRCNSSMLR